MIEHLLKLMGKKKKREKKNKTYGDPILAFWNSFSELIPFLYYFYLKIPNTSASPNSDFCLPTHQDPPPKLGLFPALQPVNASTAIVGFM